MSGESLDGAGADGRANRENEISAAPRLLTAVDVRGKTIAGDAMLAQRKLSEQIGDAGGHHLWIIKDNHPTVVSDWERRFTAPRFVYDSVAADFRSHTAIDKGHGRVEQ